MKRRHSSRIVRISPWALCVACGFAQSAHRASAQDSRPAAREHSAAAGLNYCIHTLTDEAKKSKADGALVRNALTFKKDYGGTLPPQLLLERITRRIDDDSFIDAYVRWQLTAFDVPDFAMTDAAFDRVLQTLPGSVENPRANQGLIDALNKAAAAGKLSEAQQGEVNAKLNDLAAKTSAAESFNLPTMELRKWLMDKFRAQPHRVLLLMLEGTGNRARAGWPVEDSKNELDKALEAAARKREFAPEQRRDFLKRAAAAITTGRLIVAGAGLADGTVNVSYTTSGIFDFDVRRWERKLRQE